MDLSNNYLQLPKEIVNTFYEDSTKVFVGGKLKISEFENEFKDTMRGETLSSEKALHIAMQVPERPLPSIHDALTLLRQR